MTEPTLSVDYNSIARRLATQIGGWASYSTGTVTVSAGTITLASGTWPTWAGTASTGSSAINIAGTFYPIATRTNGTVLTISDTSVAASAGSKYFLVQSNLDRLEDVGEQIDNCINSGYRDMLFPGMIEGQQSPMTGWSFLRKEATQVLSSSDYDYDLPDDFGQHIFWAVFAASNDRPLNIVERDQFLTQRGVDSQTGTPTELTWRDKTFDASAGRRFEMLLYPTPDATKTLTYSYLRIPDKLTPGLGYPVCGAMHGELLLSACLAASERLVDDRVDGPHSQDFMRRLQASLQLDMKPSQWEGGK